MSEDEPEEEDREDEVSASTPEVSESTPEEPAAPDDEAVDPASVDEEDLPLSELRKRVESREDGESALSEIDAETTEAEASELFEEVDVSDIDGEVVWDAVVEGEADPAELLGEEATVEEEPAVEPGEMADEHVVDKREYCQRCEYFSAPPNATCSNEGTEIVELVDSDHFRVQDCPKVAVDDDALSGFATDGE